MKMLLKAMFIALATFALTSVTFTMATAAPTACTAGKGVCTTSDKTIDGKQFSCEKCKQAMCEGNRIVGSQTKSVCTEKSTTSTSPAPPKAFERMRGMARVGGAKMQQPTPVTRPSGQNQNPEPGKTLIMTRMTGGGGSTGYTCTYDVGTPGHPGESSCSCTGGRESYDCANMLEKCKSGPFVDDLVCTPDKKCSCNAVRISPTGGKRPLDEAVGMNGRGSDVRAKGQKPGKLMAPTSLAISKIGSNGLTLSWQDNSIREYGVAVYRMQSNAPARRSFKKADWKYVGSFQERISANVTGKGKRQDQDTGLTPSIKYCYRLQAYFGFDKSETSGFSNTACARTSRIGRGTIRSIQRR